jgi:hypothetical protein
VNSSFLWDYQQYLPLCIMAHEHGSICKGFELRPLLWNKNSMDLFLSVCSFPNTGTMGSLGGKLYRLTSLYGLFSEPVLVSPLVSMTLGGILAQCVGITTSHVSSPETVQRNKPLAV